MFAQRRGRKRRFASLLTTYATAPGRDGAQVGVVVVGGREVGSIRHPAMPPRGATRVMRSRTPPTGTSE
ncbi:hypothetical protein [Rhodococcus sp. ACS1]|uniref:hypothetical protein n=1 Tax=Rhodococcus sp. ACS1 TaxID=2028570 RepID=UPI001C52C69F|nr:hypothetical protein [Rhodococcus sp. ACS1]